MKDLELTMKAELMKTVTTMKEEEKNPFEGIVLDREEEYDTQTMDCWAFSKRGVFKNGIELLLGNMIGGFPITVNGITYPCSEILYLSGQFSKDTPEHAKVRKDLLSISNGFMAKKMIKAKNKHLIREDFDGFSTQWMLWVVWQKTLQNEGFQKLLMNIPKDAVIIEDSSEQTSKTATLWGCRNDELLALKKQKEKEITAQYKGKVCKTELKRLKDEAKMAINDIGVFRGKNNMGKILMMCKRAIEEGWEVPIDYGVLVQSGIYLGDGEKVF